jgi:hypothetical protein
MSFYADGTNVKGLLEVTRVYRIPRFQRDFSWDLQNYKEFFNDMLSQIKFNKSLEKFETNQYFLGNMLFLGGRDSLEVDVVDGQQRLTVITIVLAVIRNALDEECKKEGLSENLKTKAQDIAETTHTYIIKKHDGKIQRKIETLTSYPYFTQTIQDFHTRNENVVATTEEEELLKSAFDFFTKQIIAKNLIKEMSKKHGIKIEYTKYIDLLICLRDQILVSQVIAIFADQKDQANQIFSNINSKGKPLSKVDLIKNKLFEYVDITDAGVDELSIFWQNMQKEIANLDTSISEYFIHYWKAIYPKDSVTGNSLFNKFYKKINSEEKCRKFIKDIEKSFPIYKKIISPDLQDYKPKQYKYEYEALLAISRFNGIQIRPAILSFMIKENLNPEKNKINNKIRVSLFNFLSDFHFVAFGTGLGLRSNQVTTHCKIFSEEIDKAESKDEIIKAVNNLKKNLFKLIDKEKFISEFKKLSFEKSTARKSFKDSFSSSFAVKRIAKYLDRRDYEDSDYSIEHILNESENEVTTNIGNLMVLEEKINNSLSKISSFEDKKETYQESKYTMVKELCKRESFNLNDIDDRATELAEIFWRIFEAESQNGN